jgi:hypothetical protein
MLTLRDRTFDLSSATFGALLSLDEDVGWHFRWSFEFNAIGRKFDGETWQPRLYAEGLELSLPAPLMLPGHSFFVEDAFNAHDEPTFTLYVFEHEPAYEMAIVFGRWQGNSIELTLSGKADLNWGDKYGKSVPIQVKYMAVFKGINVYDRTEESARARLAAFYDPDSFDVEKSRVGFKFRIRQPDGISG